MAINIALSYDIERPYGDLARTPKAREFMAEQLHFNERLTNFLDGQGVPRTVFILGDWLERSCEELGARRVREVFDPTNKLAEIQSHTYAHRLLVKLALGEDAPIVSPVEFEADLRKSIETMRRRLGIRPRGLSMPYGYEEDLSDLPKILETLAGTGFEYVCSMARGKISLLLTELTLDRQPHSYVCAGFPQIVEVPIHGWQDAIFTKEKAARFLGREPDSQSAILRHYEDLLDTGVRLSQQVPELYIGLSFHPWAMDEYDPELKIHAEILAMARERKMVFTTFGRIAKKVAAKWVTCE